MKRIHSSFNQKDRVVCTTIMGGHKFYYQPFNSKERTFLFETDDFSGSVFAYFRDKGRNMSGRGFSLTMKEIYEFKRFRNVKLTAVFNRILMMVDYVLREQEEQIMHNNTIKEERSINNIECERAA